MFFSSITVRNLSKIKKKKNISSITVRNLSKYLKKKKKNTFLNIDKSILQ